MLLASASILALSSLISCGNGGDSGSSGTDSPTISAQFIDSPVKGLNIEKASGNTVTGVEGNFTCVLGEAVRFKIRDFMVGNGPCGNKVFLDDVAPVNADRIAAVIQSLSKPDAATGIIDLSNIPENYTGLASIDVTSDSNLATSLGSVKTTLGASNYVPTVTPVAARAHLNAQLAANAPTGNLADDLGAMAAVTEGVAILATRTAGDADYCSEKVAARLEIKNTNNYFTASLRQVVASDDGRETCSDLQEENGECSRQEGIIAEYRKVVTSPIITLGSTITYTFNHTIVYSEGQEIGYPHGTTTYNGKDYQEAWVFESNGEFISVDSIKNYYPFVADTSNAIKIDLSNYPSEITGTVFEKSFYFSVSDYVSAADYTLVKSSKECQYSISKR